MLMKTLTDKILEEFDLLTRNEYELDLEYEEAKVWLKNNPHLFTGGIYDEPMLTLDMNNIYKGRHRIEREAKRDNRHWMLAAILWCSILMAVGLTVTLPL